MSLALAILALALGVLVWAVRREPAADGEVLADAAALAARQQRLRGEQVRLENELDLLRGVFEVSAELVGCVDEADLRTRLSGALSRYWSGAGLELLVWERGSWRGLGGNVGMPPELGAPVALPEGEDHDLVLDLSPAVDGQAALVLRDAHDQPSIASLGVKQRRAVAELLRGQFALSLRRVMLFRSLQELARSDPLTGAWRRWYGEARLAELTEAGAVVAVCMADIDRFKRINDTYGHGGGDKVLAAVAKALAAGVRSEDIVARIGGEEFLVVLPATTPAGAAQVAERLRAAVAAIKGLPEAVTISLGVACCWRDESAFELVARADEALYRAKAEGRDRVVCADGPDDLPHVRMEAARRDPGSSTSLQRVKRAPNGAIPPA